ncbi:MAG: G5 domain-containing protein [Clostridia bacterium]|nr:G5 domain-containing protein [Clostridia bacterium]
MIIRIQDAARVIKKICRIAACVICISAVLGVTTALAMANLITTQVVCQGVSVTVSSFSNDPYEIVEKAGVELNEKDVVDLDSFDISSENSVINIKKAYEVIVFDEEKEPVRAMVAGTVKDVLDSAGITLGKWDIVNRPLDSEITENMFIVVSRAFKVIVSVDGEEKGFKVAEGTVKELLEKNNIRLGKNDIINIDPDSELVEKTRISIKRVEYKTVKEKVSIPYETVTKESDTLYIGQSQVKTPGENGKQTDYYKEKYVDGEKTKTTFVKSVVTKEPKEKVVLKGTKVRPLSISLFAAGENGVISELTPTLEIELDENGRPKNYKKLITGKATAYCGGGITATGQKAMPGRVAVNPRQIPYGTKMYIISADGKYVYGYCEASDTGGFARKGTATVDLYMHSYDDCMQFGRRMVEIYILE